MSFCSNNACFTCKKCCEARGCTNFQITDQLCNCKHIVCKILHIIVLLDVSMTLINNLHLGIYIAKVKDHDFYRWGSTSQWWRPHPIWSSSHEEMVSFLKRFGALLCLAFPKNILLTINEFTNKFKSYVLFLIPLNKISK